jgi:Tol biopolymer transport system component
LNHQFPATGADRLLVKQNPQGTPDILLLDTSSNTTIEITAGVEGVRSASPKISVDGNRIFFIQSKPNESEGVSDLLTYDLVTRTTHLISGKLGFVTFKCSCSQQRRQ